MNLCCYRCGIEKCEIEDFSPSVRNTVPSKTVCKKCKANEMRKYRDGDPKMKWGRFDFKRS